MKSERRRRRKKGTVKSKVGIKREARYFYIPGHRNSICSGVFFLPLSNYQNIREERGEIFIEDPDREIVRFVRSFREGSPLLSSRS